MKKTYKVKVTWSQHPSLSSIVEVDDVESVAEAEQVSYGMSGEFYFEQGGRGSMSCPDNAEVVE